MTLHCRTCSCTDEWPELPTQQPAVPVLDQIRHRKVSEIGGGSEPKAIVAETRDFVVYRVWSAKGEDLGESVPPKVEFEQRFERRAR